MTALPSSLQRAGAGGGAALFQVLMAAYFRQFYLRPPIAITSVTSILASATEQIDAPLTVGDCASAWES